MKIINALFKYLTIWLLTLRQHLSSAPVVFGGIHVAHHFSYLCVVLLCVFTLIVPCCNVCYDFLINTMFGSTLPSVACLKAYVLFTLCCSLVVSNSNCVVIFVVLLQVSLDCPSLIAPLVFCNVLFALEAFSFDITHVYIFLTFDFIGINIHRTCSVCSVCICTCSRFDRTSSVCSVYLFSVKNI
jgi:hypothetical protein